MLRVVPGLVLAIVVGASAAALISRWLARPAETEEAPRIVVAPLEPPPSGEVSIAGDTRAQAETHAASDLNVAGPVVDDSWVNGMLAEVATHPLTGRVLASDHMVDRFVRAVDAVAGGFAPTTALGPLAPQGAFLVRRAGDQLVVAAGTWQRFDLLVDVFVSLDSRRVANRFAEAEPKLEAAYRRISWGDDGFEHRLSLAVDHLLATPVPDHELTVVRDGLWWEFADQRLAMLSGAQRQLLRLGPSNARRVQAKLRELRTALALDPGPASPRAVAALTQDQASPAVARRAVHPDPSVALVSLQPAPW